MDAVPAEGRDSNHRRHRREGRPRSPSPRDDDDRDSSRPGARRHHRSRSRSRDGDHRRGGSRERDRDRAGQADGDDWYGESMAVEPRAHAGAPRGDDDDDDAPERMSAQDRADAAEIERRRRKVEQWQAARKQKEAATTADPESVTGAGAVKAWTFGDDEHDDEDDRAGDGDGAAARATADLGLTRPAPPPLPAAAPEVPAPLVLGIRHPAGKQSPAAAVAAAVKIVGARPGAIVFRSRPPPPQSHPVPTPPKPTPPITTQPIPTPPPVALPPPSPSPSTAPAASSDRPTHTEAAADAREAVDEIDPLDAFMSQMASSQRPVSINPVPPQPQPRATVTTRPVSTHPDAGDATRPTPPRRKKRPVSSDESSSGAETEGGGGGNESSDDDAWVKRASTRVSKSDKLPVIDHAAIAYEPFRKNFYIESAESKRMTEADVAAYRKSLDDIKVRGRDVPRPVKTWAQCGLSAKVLDLIKKAGFESPMPIQAQALPVIMAGRDCIGIAKTGSGKTAAFVLPMLRHIKDQPELEPGDGPIALIMAPTRELVQQIAKDAKKFAKPLGLTVACVYGGSGVAAQITELKRGAEIVVCTPGRMIDILATGGKITNFRRTTYLVLDEADRMYDMGFEPQITKIVGMVRPSRQTVMFSATFPRQVEMLARTALTAPVEIQVGGRAVVNADITQIVEIRPEEERFRRLLELLGEWYEAGKVLIFVHSQDKCDTIFRDLMKVGYPCLSLHGGKEQSDRECTISDFKGTVCSVLVATSVAARGLDVKELVLVINYDVPSHHEDYVHRVGRTGRAGNKGTAITFIAPDEDAFAPDLVKALKESGQVVPGDLAAMADAFAAKRRDGKVQAHGSGYGGTGFKFDKKEDDVKKSERRATAAGLGYAPDDDDGHDEGGHGLESMDGVKGALDGGTALDVGAMVAAASAAGSAAKSTAAATAVAGAAVANAAAAAAVPPWSLSVTPVAPSHPLPPPSPASLPPESPASAPGLISGPTIDADAATRAAAAAAAALARHAPLPPAAPAIVVAPVAAGPVQPMFALQRGPPLTDAQAKAAAFASALNLQVTIAKMNAARASGRAIGGPGGFSAELDINDIPQHARFKLTHKETMATVTEFTGAAITIKGLYVAPGRACPPGERKIYMLIEGPSESSVKAAKAELKKLVDTLGPPTAGGGQSGGGGARYTL